MRLQGIELLPCEGEILAGLMRSLARVAGENGIPPKPDPEPFRLCLQELNLEPSAAVYVGDDYRIDVCGARDAGLHAVWLKHHSVRRSWPDVQTSTPIISHLDELLDIERMVKVL